MKSTSEYLQQGWWHNIMTMNDELNRSNAFNELDQILRNDEKLMRLLHYSPVDEAGRYVNPYDENLPDILTKSNAERYRIEKAHLVKSVKVDTIVNTKTSIVYVHQGRRREVFGNRFLMRQEILVDVLVHNDYQTMDRRLAKICDRLDSLIVGTRLGLSETIAVNSIPMESPKEYYRYQLRYEFKETMG